MSRWFLRGTFCGIIRARHQECLIMPKDYTPAVRQIQTPTTQTRRADGPQALAELEQILTDELAPATPIAAMLARDLVQLEVDIIKLRQARRDIDAQALAEQVRAAFERSHHDRVFYYGLLQFDKFLADLLGPRRDISRRNAFILKYFKVDFEALRVAAFRRNADLMFKIDERLEKMEKRRRLLRRDYDVFASDRARIIEAPE